MTQHNSSPSTSQASRPNMRFGSMFGEIAPLAAFFTVNQFYGLYMGALSAVCVSALLILYIWVKEKRLARFDVFATAVSSVLTVAALIAEEKIYIKIQPSLFNLCFSVVLLGGILTGRTMMKEFFKSQFDLPDRVWFQLSLRWGLFFALATIANEWAWRALSDDDWVTFRVLVMAPATGVFMLGQLPLTLRGLREQTAMLRQQSEASI